MVALVDALFIDFAPGYRRRKAAGGYTEDGSSIGVTASRYATRVYKTSTGFGDASTFATDAYADAYVPVPTFPLPLLVF